MCEEGEGEVVLQRKVRASVGYREDATAMYVRCGDASIARRLCAEKLVRLRVKREQKPASDKD